MVFLNMQVKLFPREPISFTEHEKHEFKHSSKVHLQLADKRRSNPSEYEVTY